MVSSDNDLTDTTKYVDRIFFPKGTLIKIEGIPFWLESDTVLLGNRGNLSLIDYDKSLGVPSVLNEDQSETSDETPG